MGKGSARRPGEGFEDGWERIFKPRSAEIPKELAEGEVPDEPEDDFEVKED